MTTSQVQILEENEYFFIINKPNGLSVHNNSPSVAEFLTKKKKALHFVNRLDLETSGLMLIAQKPEYHTDLALELENSTKTYRALLRGAWKPGKPTVWKKPLSDKAEGRANPQGISAIRLPAESQVKVIRTNEHLTEAHVTILTGRQHQIRKHAALANHPVVGDPRYNEAKYNERIAKLYGEKRMQLHAEILSFEFKGKNYNFKCPINFDKFFKSVVIS